MFADELEQVRALCARGKDETYLREAMALARRHGVEVAAQIEAAYACDRYGDEHDAIRFYDAAWRLGVPDRERRHFLVGYGSTLRNVGRVDESVTLLAEAHAQDPDYVPLPAFLALSLLDAGQSRLAVATLLEVVLALARDSEALDGYQRALAAYQHELIDKSLAPAK